MLKAAAAMALAALVSVPAIAGTISGFRDKYQVRQLVTTAIEQWVANPDGASACGGADCCPNTRANDQCTGAPLACCTGEGVGACDSACVGINDPYACCTGVGTGACDASCVKSGAPAACCAGNGTGTCNDEACVAFSQVVQLDPVGWADDVEGQLQFDGDWLCNTFPAGYNDNRRETVCTAVSGTPIIDVSRILSEFANIRSAP